MAQVVFETCCSFRAVHRIIFCGNAFAKFSPQHRRSSHCYGGGCHLPAVSQPGIDCNHGIVNLLPDYRKNPKILFQKMQQYHHLGPQIKCPKLKKSAHNERLFF